jgi:hypothetical protein
MLSFVMLNVVMLCVIMLSVIMLSVIMLSVVKLSVVAPLKIVVRDKHSSLFWAASVLMEKKFYTIVTRRNWLPFGMMSFPSNDVKYKSILR